MHILLIDDHELFRAGLSTALRTFDDNITISVAGSVSAARTIIKQSHQILDLILLDHSLPDGEGLELLKYIRHHYPLLPIAMLSAHENPKLMKQSLESGALGFIPKSTSTAIMLPAIQLMLSGGTYIPPKLLPSLSASSAPAVPEAKMGTAHLTQRQQEVLSLICQGLPNKEIAWQLNITEGTVKAHTSVILKAKGYFSRKQLIASGY